MRRTGFIIILIAFAQLVFAQIEKQKVHFDKQHWTEYIKGNMPLVISVPHGGTLLLPDVPIRDCAGSVTVTDSRTMELAREIQKVFEESYQLRPHIIICHLSRKNVDQNRAIDEGTCGNQQMEAPWNSFHNYIDSALNLAGRQFGKTMYIDLHGHGHKIQQLELGYLLKADDLRNLQKNKADELSTATRQKKTSIDNFLLHNKNSDLDSILYGENAFGSIVSDLGFLAVPSKQHKAPAVNEKYFNGGYNTVTYTSDMYPDVFGFQIESNYKGVRDEEGRPVFAKAFAKAYMEFIRNNTNIKIEK